MSVDSDAVWIMEELLDEILGRITFRDVEKKFNDRKTHEKSEVKKEHDWVKLIDADMKELIGKCFSEEVCGNAETIVCEKIDEGMKEVIGDEENVNRKNIVIEKKEEKFPEYKTMGFNWKEVDPIFKG
jgi:hypothetical protein